MFRKLEFELPFKYYISILGGRGLRPCFFAYLGGGIQNSRTPAYIILASSLMDEKKKIIP